MPPELPSKKELCRAASHLPEGNSRFAHLELEEDEQIGANIVIRALEEPLRQIATNAGIEGAVIVEQVKAGEQDGYGLNAETGELQDLTEAGIH